MMLSSDLLSQFAKITNDRSNESKETTVFGTVVNSDDGFKVRIDGSEVLTPVTMAVEAIPGERVAVMIKNHAATVTSNISSPLARLESVENVNEKVGEFQLVITNELNAVRVDTNSLIADNALIKNQLTVQNAEIEYLETEVAKIDTAKIESLEAEVAKIEVLESEVAKIDDLEAEVAKIDTAKIKQLETEVAKIENLESEVAKIETLESEVAKIDDLEAEVAKIDLLDAEYARLDKTNIATGWVTTAMIDVAAITTTQIADGSITNAKIVDLSANKINAGTLSVERLEIRGSNKSIVYALNNITGALQAQNVDTLNGEILTERTITADKIVANAITANEIASRTITANNIVSGAITANEIASRTITADRIKASSITANEIAANTITAAKIASRTITADRIKSGVITANEIASRTITADRIKSGVITANEIAASTITGDKIAANTITANKIDVDDLFAQNITATGTITGAEIIGAKGEFTKGFDIDVYHNLLTGEIYDAKPSVHANGTYARKGFTINPKADSMGMTAIIDVYNNNVVTKWNAIDIRVGAGFTAEYQDSDGSYNRLQVYDSITMETDTSVIITGGQGLLVRSDIAASGGVYSDNWFRSYGQTGWYNETYGGGIWMTDTTYVRVSHGKVFACDNLIYGQRLATGWDSGIPGAVSCSNWFRSTGQSGWFNDTYGGGVYMTDTLAVRIYNKSLWIDNLTRYGQLEMYHGGFNVIFRNDGTYFYILPGNANGWTATTWWMDTSGRTFMNNGFLGRGSGYYMSLSSDNFFRCYDSGLNMIDGVIRVGSPNYRVGQIYSTSASISTSDRNQKKNINELEDKHFDFLMKLLPVSFQFIDGTSGRTHIGFIAQDVEEAMIESGLSDLDFAGFCKDKKQIGHEYEDGSCWYEDVLDEDGNIQYIYALRYEEFIALAVLGVQRCYKEIQTLKGGV